MQVTVKEAIILIEAVKIRLTSLSRRYNGKIDFELVISRDIVNRTTDNANWKEYAIQGEEIIEIKINIRDTIN
jgi:hypothetical protein